MSLASSTPNTAKYERIFSVSRNGSEEFRASVSRLGLRRLLEHSLLKHIEVLHVLICTFTFILLLLLALVVLD
jgi:hypothetical protein